MKKSKLTDLWYNEYVVKYMCGLCGNHGFIDTRNKVKSSAGIECGGVFYCICPNGRVLKKGKALLPE
jgi:hypothetical protein